MAKSRFRDLFFLSCILSVIVLLPYVVKIEGVKCDVVLSWY